MTTTELHLHDLGVCPGESDPAAMLAGVLMLLVAVAAMATLALALLLV